MKNEELDSALGLKVSGCDAGEDLTIREYLREQHLTLWEEGEGFSGKRPFGNSGWEWDVYVPLVMAGFVPGVFDEEFDEVVEVDEPAALEFVQRLIKHMLQ